MERINQRTNHLVGKNLRRLRIEHGLQNKDVVARLQLDGIPITSGTYSKVERGQNNPSVDMLITLTHVYKCDFNEFFKPM